MLNLSQLGYVEQLTWQMAMPFIKISLLLFYFRIFPNRSMRLATYIVGAVVVGLLISTTVVAVMSCVPVPYYWDRTIPGGHCLNYNLFYIIGAAFNSTTDLVVLCLPLPVIWGLQVDVQKKIGLSFIFLLGGLYAFPPTLHPHLCLVADSYIVSSLQASFAWQY